MARLGQNVFLFIVILVPVRSLLHRQMLGILDYDFILFFQKDGDWVMKQRRACFWMNCNVSGLMDNLKTSRCALNTLFCVIFICVNATSRLKRAHTKRKQRKENSIHISNAFTMILSMIGARHPAPHTKTKKKSEITSFV